MPVDSVKAPLSGKIAVITGASKGLGQAIAVDFAKQGCSHIAITYLTTDPAETVSAIKTVSTDIVTYAVKADFHDDSFGAKVVEQSMKGLEVDHIDILVSNAALVDAEAYLPLEKIDKSTFDMYMTTNAWAALHLAMSAIPHIRPNTDGRIIFISSGGSKMAFGDPLAGHCFSKAAMDSISANLAKVYGKEKGMTINSIGVGVTETASFQAAVEKWPGYRTYAENLSALGRAGSPEEVAHIVSFVASPEASWINGNQVPANGGMLSQLQA